MEDLVNKIEELEKELSDLKKELDEYNNLREDRKLAEHIHSRFCHSSHEDYCSWFYESWEKPGYTRNSYLEKAQNVLKISSFDVAKKIISIL